MEPFQQSNHQRELLQDKTFINLSREIVQDVINQQEIETFYNNLQECLLNLPPLKVMENPLTINNVINKQSTDVQLQQKVLSDPDFFQHKEIEGFKVIHTKPSNEDIWKIAVPNTLLPQLLKWYHLVLGHYGQQQLYNTVKTRFHGNLLQKACINVVNNCLQKCQMNKQSNMNYRHLPPREAGLFPLETVAIDILLDP